MHTHTHTAYIYIYRRIYLTYDAIKLPWDVLQICYRCHPQLCKRVLPLDAVALRHGTAEGSGGWRGVHVPWG